MTDPIEKWREDFEEIVFQSRNGLHINRRSLFRKSQDGIYCSSEIENKWDGYLMARRSQPVVELPSDSDVIFISGSAADGFDWNSLEAKEKYIESFAEGASCILDTIKYDLKSSGIQYRIKGE